MHPYLAVLTVAACSLGLVHGYDVYVNADNGQTFGSSQSISWVTKLTGNVKGRCSQMGVIKLNFGAPKTKGRKEKVLIDMWFNNPVGWTFNIGDSRTNNGYGGDASSTRRDAEVHSIGRHFFVYGNDFSTPKGALIRRRNNIIGNRLQVIISDGHVIWNNLGMEFNFEFDSQLLFALNGQSDPGKTPNYDIYFGINRVIENTRRRGRGLCWAGITWLS